MDKQEKIIRGLEQFIADFKPFCGNKADWQRVYDAIALLKAQEPVKPYAEYSEHTGTKWLTCGACNQPMIKITPDVVYPNYCPECGRKVWWE